MRGPKPVQDRADREFEALLKRARRRQPSGCTASRGAPCARLDDAAFESLLDRFRGLDSPASETGAPRRRK